MANETQSFNPSNFFSSLGSSLFGNVFGSLLGESQRSSQAQREYHYQVKLMEQQQKYALQQLYAQQRWQQQMFEMQNEYNDPSAMLTRYRSAGINPAAMMGNSGVQQSGTMAAPSSPSGGSVSSGHVSSNIPNPQVDNAALVASQVQLNNATASEKNQSANLLGSKVLTESSVRSMLASTVAEKDQNAYFLHQRAIGQEITNSKMGSMMDQQINNLKASTDNFISQSNLNSEQISVVRAQAAELMFRSMLDISSVQLNQKLGQYYKSASGFINLQKEDLDYQIQALLNTGKFSTFAMDESGTAVVKTFTIDGYSARALAAQLSAMRGYSEAAIEAIRADWENPNQWNNAINMYWDSVNGTLGSVLHLVGMGKLAGASKAAAAASVEAATINAEARNTPKLETTTYERAPDGSPVRRRVTAPIK